MAKRAPNEFANELFKHDQSVALSTHHRGGKWQVDHITKSIETYGYKKADFISGALCWDDIVYPDVLDALRATCADYETQEINNYSVFYRIKTADGEIIWVSEYASVNRDQDGNVLTIDSIVFNYNRMHDFVQRLDEQVRRQELLTDILQTLHAEGGEQSFYIILDKVCRYLNFGRALIIKDNKEQTRGKAIYEWHAEDTQALMAPSFTIGYDCIPSYRAQIRQSGRCIVVGAQGKGIVSSMFTIYSDNARYGLLIFDERAEREAWSEDMIQFLEHIVELVSTAVMQHEHQEEMRASREHINQMAYLDHLTKLPNRYRFESVIWEAARDALRRNRCGYVLFIDIDDFKIINDGFGHGVGDKLLLVFAQYFKHHFANQFEVFRFGGDEFILLIRPEKSAEIKNCIDAIVKRTHSPWKVEEHTFYCTFSIGIVQYPDYGRDAESILRNADVAMYQAKQKGKSCHVYYSDTWSNDSLKRVEMERILRNSIWNGFSGFEVHYQPIVHAKTERIKGVEALIRWRSSTGILVPPSQFIPLAEYLGLIVPIGEYILREAALFCKQINNAGRKDFAVSVNVSIKQIHQSDFVQKVFRILSDVGVCYDNIILEITEGLAVTDLDKCNVMFDELRSKGIKIAIDDFGTGYSSLNYMREMSVDIIKIDRAFVRDIANDPFSQYFVRLITELGHIMGKLVCVEGVETEDQLKYCLETNSDMIQGYFYYKAIPMDDLMDIFHSENYIQNPQEEQIEL